MNVKELIEKRKNVWQAAKAFLDAHEKNGVLSADDRSTYERMEQEINDLSESIDRQNRLDELEKKLGQPTTEALKGEPRKNGNLKTGRTSDEYKNAFRNHLRTGIAYNTLSEGVLADGGYLVPTEFENQIIDTIADENVIRSVAKIIKTSSEHKIPVVASHGIAQITAENGAYASNTPTFAQKTLDAYKYTYTTKASIEMLQDSMFDLESFLLDEFSRAFASAEEQAFCVGAGTTEPTGIFTANGGSLGVTANANNAITADELINLVYSLRKPYRKNAKFITNDSTVSLIRKLKDNNGAYLWQPSMQAGEPDKLLGYDLLTSPYVPTVGASAYAFAFGDFNNYWIADRMGITVQRLNEVYAINGQVGFTAAERVDGKVILAEGIKLLKMKS